EDMARRARALTIRHFGRTIGLYAPLYLANFCTNGCAYCGFASDRPQPRRRLELPEVEKELDAIRALGFDDALLLTGERTSAADFGYLRDCVSLAGRAFDAVGIETFPMETGEYAGLADEGCNSVTIYQETYDPARYDLLHRWGPKKDYAYRLDAPSRALSGGMRTAGLGFLLGLADPVSDALSLLLHAMRLQKTHWRSGITLSFPRMRPEGGGYEAPFPVGEAMLARMIFAFRIVLPTVPILLSTRERPGFRDGMAGVGVTKMSAGSRTTVGGYEAGEAETEGQFRVNDDRGLTEFCGMLRGRRLEPVFKNWDRVFQGAAGGDHA
ncbi:MAG TPA: 2-iminoacetate synthase ThiH, partial [Candidatus Deferrimicrobiaceae bacterium]